MMLWDGTVEERIVDLKNAGQVAQIREFLAAFELSFTGEVDYTLAFYRDDRIIATGSLDGEVLRNIAVDPSLQGEGLNSVVVSRLMQEAGRRGIYHYFLFTKPETVRFFTDMGFKEIGRSDPYAVLLESGLGSVQSYCQELAREVSGLPEGPRAGLVVNCNPFTLGHKAVIEKAAAENAAVVVLVVSEDRSVFPFPDRIRLVREGLAGQANIVVLPAGKYNISAATFPGYFTKGDATIAAQTRLDAGIFARYIAPALGITCRYVGTEPYSLKTREYNTALQEILPQYGISVCEMSRLVVDNEVVSASRVRRLICEGNWERIRQLVPASTFQYLQDTTAAPVIAKILAGGPEQS